MGRRTGRRERTAVAEGGGRARRSGVGSRASIVRMVARRPSRRVLPERGRLRSTRGARARDRRRARHRQGRPRRAGVGGDVPGRDPQRRSHADRAGRVRPEDEHARTGRARPRPGRRVRGGRPPGARAGRVAGAPGRRPRPGRRRPRRARPPVPAATLRDRDRPAATDRVDPRRPERPGAGGVQRPDRVLARSGLGRARARLPRLDRVGPRVRAGAARRVGSGRHRGHRRGHAGGGRARLVRPEAHGADGRVSRRLHRAQPVGPPSGAVRGRGRPVRRHGSVRPGRDDTPVRGALSRHRRRSAPGRRGPLPGQLADQRRRPHHRAAADPPGRRGQGGPAGSEPRHRRAAAAAGPAGRAPPVRG